MAFVCVHVCARVCTCKPVCSTNGGVEAGEVCQVSCSVARLFSIQDTVSLSWKLIWLASEHQGICLSASQCWDYRIGHAYMCFYFYVIQAQVFIFA